MEEINIDLETIIASASAITCVVAIHFLIRKFPRSQGKNILNHILFLVAVSIGLFTIPEFIQKVLFSHIGVLLIGILIPVRESIRSICTFEYDDTVWLQYWLIAGSFQYFTEWLDVIAESYPSIDEHWHRFEMILLLWLMLPFTDGATLVHKSLTEPLLAPFANSLKKQLEGYMSWILVAVNSGYLWMMWMTFMTLDEEARRFIVVAVGTVYPLVASAVALSTNSYADGNFWLTYWSCFNILFAMMDYLEHFVGSIRGFYSLCLFGTVYLFLPMFKGAEIIFRSILVPLSGRQEKLLLRDVHLLRMEMEKKLPKHAHERVFKKASSVFEVSAKKTD